MKMLTSAKAKLLKGKKNQEEESIDNKKIKVSKAFLIFTFKSFNYKHFHKPFLTQLPKQLLLWWCEFVYPSCTRFWVCQQISAMFEVKHLGLDSYDIPPQNRSPWPHEAMEPWLLRSQDSVLLSGNQKVGASLCATTLTQSNEDPLIYGLPATEAGEKDPGLAQNSGEILYFLNCYLWA